MTTNKSSEIYIYIYIYIYIFATFGCSTPCCQVKSIPVISHVVPGSPMSIAGLDLCYADPAQRLTTTPREELNISEYILHI